ncbi:MAG: hypothetical protein JJD92_06825 [Frankiaceae bacterium]|nr:hypothetical protein [Frankiaceae bacterium]
MKPAVRRLSPRALTTAAAAAGAGLTLVVVLVPGLQFAYVSPRWHLVLETFDGGAAAAVAVLFFGRYRRSQTVTDLCMTTAFFLLALNSAAVVMLPPADERNATAAVWLPLVTRLAAAALVAVAALDTSLRRPSAVRVHLLLPLTALAFLTLTAFAAVGPLDLPRAIDPSLDPSDSGRPLLSGHAVIQVAQLVHALLYAFASVGFTRAAARTSDGMLRWIGVGCAIGACARLNYLLFPSLYSPWLYTGDVLRTAFYVALLAGGLRELQGYWSAQTDAAVFEERRRLARDLHDGTVQELGYIRSLTAAAGRRAAVPELERIGAAADRALAEARAAIYALSTTVDEPLDDLLRRAAVEIADRYDMTVEIDAAPAVEATEVARTALVRIVREAVSNAARHGAATRVVIRIRSGQVDVVDDGSGFDGSADDGGGFGLISMKDRAMSVGASVSVRRHPGGGTIVSIEWAS